MTGFPVDSPLLLLRTPGRIASASPRLVVLTLASSSVPVVTTGCGELTALVATADAETWSSGSSSTEGLRVTSRCTSASPTVTCRTCGL